MGLLRMMPADLQGQVNVCSSGLNWGLGFGARVVVHCRPVTLHCSIMPPGMPLVMSCADALLVHNPCAGAAACAGLAPDSPAQTCLMPCLQQHWTGARVQHRCSASIGLHSQEGPFLDTSCALMTIVDCWLAQPLLACFELLCLPCSGHCYEIL